MASKPTWERTAPQGSTVDPRVRYRLTSLDALRTVMVARGFMSGNALARSARIGVGTVNHLVHGRRNTASAQTVRALREALGKDADALFVLEKSTVHVDESVAA